MNPEIKRLVRAHIKGLNPYSSARDEYKGDFGVFLDANENPFGSVSGGAFNRYPDPYQLEVKTRLSELKGVAVEQIFLGNGSDEIIDLLFRVFCEPMEDVAMTFPPTFGMYDASAGINQTELVKIPLTETYQLDLPTIKEALLPRVKIAFVCSPNNPTGNLIDRSSIEELLEAFSGLLVVDEAYVDFAPEGSCLPLLDQYPRLVVLQTFSKAWGMANLRLGMGFAHPDVISVLNKVKLPYNVNGMSQQLALEALAKPELKEKMVADLMLEREFLHEKLRGIDFIQKIYPSDANFLLVKMDEGDKRYQQLIEKQVVVRNRSCVLRCEDCLRITVGTRKENIELVENLTML